VSLPAADELFRGGRQHHGTGREMTVVPDQDESVASESARTEPASETAAEKAARRSSGRVRHDEKMTVYVTADELLDLEHARLSLRRHQALAVDRGRLVREAIAIALEDLEANGDDSVLVQRLIGR
jgi:uncharacterized protein involved in copper resistance